MKLVYLSELRLPTKNAHGFQIMSMCSAFANQGSAVELVVPRRSNILKEDPFDFYQIPKTFVITKLPVIDLYPLRFIPERISGFLYLFSFLISARLYLLFKPYDALYTREPFVGLFFKKFFLEVHMPEHTKPRGFRPQKIIVLTHHIKDELVSRGMKADKILVAPDAVDLSLFPPRTKEEARKHLGWPVDRPTALYWGNFKLWKGVDTLAKAAQDMPNIFVVIVGATKESDLARIKAIAGGLPNTLIEGFKDHADLPWYLAAADVLVLPNTAQDENSRLYTSPLKLFEYMAGRRPIAVSDLPSLREILSEKNAVFFIPDDSKSLADAIQKILNDDSFAEKIAHQARLDVEQYTWEKRAQSILSFLNIHV